PPLRHAKAFAHVLRHMDLDVHSNPVFAGNTSSRPRAWMLIPEHGFSSDTQVLLENDGLDHILDGQIPSDLADYWQGRSFGGACGIGHLAVDFHRVVHKGLDALIAEARQYVVTSASDRSACRQGMAIALQAVVDWAGRYAAAAEAAARAEADPVRRACHERVAAACRRFSISRLCASAPIARASAVMRL
ncbi:MAG: hypothetical protein HQ567_11835, partial [Candidatus Nealsonbacteria bacterium]|nr:hypothetical protein [Candidatus Nealsonbacteria bacterium]